MDEGNPAIRAALEVLFEESAKAQEELMEELNPMAEPLLQRLMEIGEADPHKMALGCVLAAAKFVEGAVIASGREGERAVEGCYEVGSIVSNYAAAKVGEWDE